MVLTQKRIVRSRLAWALLVTFLLLLVTAWSGPKAEISTGQPIAFSHRVHATDYKIRCQYCHIYAERSPVAGVPPVKTCMGCHELIATDKPEIENLTRFWQERQPIEWVKVYDLPDFVRFTHKRHVGAGVECQECHGPVDTMEQVVRVSDLTMGWCLDCHQQRNAEIDCLICHY
jgi:hypothetical protein